MRTGLVCYDTAPKAPRQAGFEDARPGPEKKEVLRAGKRSTRAGSTAKARSVAGSGTNSVDIYLRSIRHIALLNAEDEKRLARLSAKGDSEARRIMIEANLRLVINIAKKYVNRGLQFQDLIEEGNIGLIKAVERFRTSKGCRFSTYATYWIRQAIDRAISNQANTVRLPVHITTDLGRVTRAERELRTSLNRDPEISELADRTGLSGRYVKKLNRINKTAWSLDARLKEEDDQTLKDIIVDDTVPEPVDLLGGPERSLKVRSWLSSLEETEREILSLRFGLEDDDPQTLETVGRRFGLTRERIRQLEGKALAKLRMIVEKNDLKFTDLV